MTPARTLEVARRAARVTTPAGVETEMRYVACVLSLYRSRKGAGGGRMRHDITLNLGRPAAKCTIFLSEGGITASTSKGTRLGNVC